MVAGQGGVCAICGTDNPEHVDHDHRTGRVRGILCFNCNGGLGQFRDQAHVLRGAAEYLDRTTPRYVLVHPGVTRIRQPGMQPANSAANTHPPDPTAVLGLFACLRTSAGSTSVHPAAVSG